MTTNTTEATKKPTFVGQIPADQAATTKKALLYAKLQPFDKSHPSYDPVRHHELSVRGGKARKPATRALVRLLSRKQKLYAKDICRVSSIQAVQFYKLILSVENFRSFTRVELFELLSLMRSDFEDELKHSIITNPDGTVKQLSYNGREKLIAKKQRQLELLLKVGKTFFPELRESFSLNFFKSAAPVSDPTLRLVNPPHSAAQPSVPLQTAAVGASDGSSPLDAQPGRENAPAAPAGASVPEKAADEKKSKGDNP